MSSTEQKGRINNIDEVRDAIHIEDVIGKYVDLKKRGASLTGCCPFHNEKTASFHVNVPKNFFKCFGCGEGGDAIQFLMLHEKLDFYQAVEQLAEMYNIEIHRDTKYTPSLEAKEERAEMLLVMRAATKHYTKQVMNEKGEMIHPYLEERGIQPETIDQWQLGYAPNEWRFLTPKILESGKWAVADKLGLVKNKNGQNFDFFRNRIMIPIHEIKGNVIGFGARDLSGDKDAAKYMNSPENELYHKDRVLFGLYFAQQAIRKKGFAILVEGYFDVIMLHQAGADNTVASCGTALTDSHAKLLKKHTNHVVIIRDGDAAGRKAMMKDIDILLANDLKVECVPLPDGEDPDLFAKRLITTPVAV